MNKKTLLIDLQYFPITDYILALYKFSHIRFSQYDRHRKMSFRNRCRILGANGPINLTVPIIGGRDVKQKMFEIRIDNSDNWRPRHFRSIVSGYNRSPFFEYFAESLEHLYTTKFELLEEWNLACLGWLTAQVSVELDFEIVKSDQSELPQQETTDLRDRFFPRTIANHPGNQLPYRQVFHDKFGFVPNLSVLDYLFCEGPSKLRTLIKPGKS